MRQIGTLRHFERGCRSTRQTFEHAVLEALELVTQEPALSSDVDELVALHGELVASGLTDDAAMKYVCLTLLNLNAFVYVD